MEKLKDPAMLLAVANSIGIVGTTAYFYKQLESLRLDLVKMSQSFTAVVRKVSEMEKGHQHNNEALHTLNDQIKGINQRLSELASLDNFEDMDVDIDEIISILTDHNINIERPSQSSRRRSGDRRPPSHRLDNEDRRDNRREITPRRYGKNNSYGTSTNSDRREATSRDDIRLSRTPTRDMRDGGLTKRLSRDNDERQDVRTEPSNYDDNEDLDIIDAVRSQLRP